MTRGIGIKLLSAAACIAVFSCMQPDETADRQPSSSPSRELAGQWMQSVPKVVRKASALQSCETDAQTCANNATTYDAIVACSDAYQTCVNQSNNGGNNNGGGSGSSSGACDETSDSYDLVQCLSSNGVCSGLLEKVQDFISGLTSCEEALGNCTDGQNCLHQYSDCVENSSQTFLASLAACGINAASYDSLSSDQQAQSLLAAGQCLCGGSGGILGGNSSLVQSSFSASSSSTAGSSFSASSSGTAGTSFSASSSSTAGSAYSASSSNTAGEAFHAQ